MTTIATGLVLAVLAVAPRWDSAIFLQALGESLSSDPQLWQPAVDVTADGTRQNTFVAP